MRPNTMQYRDDYDTYVTSGGPFPIVGVRTPQNVDITALRVEVIKAAPGQTIQRQIGRVWGIVSMVIWSPFLPLSTVSSGFFTLYFFASMESGQNFIPPDPDKAFLAFSDEFGVIVPLITTPGGTSFLYVVLENKHTTHPVYVTLGLR